MVERRRREAIPLTTSNHSGNTLCWQISVFVCQGNDYGHHSYGNQPNTDLTILIIVLYDKYHNRIMMRCSNNATNVDKGLYLP